MPNETDLNLFLAELIALPNETEQRTRLNQPPANITTAQLAETLIAKVDFFIRSEPQNSLKVAQLALIAAEISGESSKLGMAYRANAHALRAVGRYQEALPLYHKAVQFFQEADLASEEGRTYMGEFAALSSLGYYAECLRLGRRVRRRLTELGDRLNLARLDSNLAIVNHLLGRYTAALRQHNRAIREFEKLGQPDLIPTTRVNRANTLWQLNRFRQAAEDYNLTRAAFEQKGMQALVAIVDTNLGFLYFSQGRYNDALELLTSARNGFEATGQPDKRAQAEIDLAYCHSALGLYYEALQLYQQAYATLGEIGMKYEAIRAELGRAQVLLNTGDLTEAEQGFDRVITTYETAITSEKNEHILAIARFYRAQLIGRNGQQLAALELCQQANRTFAQLKLRDWQAQSHLLEADLLRDSQHALEAENVYRQASELLAQFNLPHLTYQLHYGLGKLRQSSFEQTAEPSEQLALVQAAYAEYQRAAEQVETIRAILRPEELRTAFMENGLGAYEALIKLCLQPPLINYPSHLEEAFSYVERSKSRNLLDMLSQNLVHFLPAADKKLTQRITELRQELNWYYSQIHSLSTGITTENERNLAQLANGELAKISEQLASREIELGELLRRYRPQLFNNAGDQPATLLPAAKAATLQELQNTLKAEETLLEYYILDNNIAAFVVTKDNLEVYYPLCKIAEVTSLQERLSFQQNKFNLGQAYVSRHLEAMQTSVNNYLAELYRLLFAPLRPVISSQRLVIVPHGNLHTLPFHALYDGRQYLLDNYEVVYAPSAAIFLHCQRQTPRQFLRNLLAVGVSDQQLVGVETEVQAVSDFFPEARILTGENATRAKLEANLEWCDVLHFASHGVFREDNPLFSLLKLNDGWLSVHDIMEWRLNAVLVTLSACHTGLNQPLKGDELLGLARSFFFTGAKTLVVSLWAVNDIATSHLMTYFYQNLATGQNCAAALRLAMLQLRAEPEYCHPYYWAPFVVIGRP